MILYSFLMNSINVTFFSDEMDIHSVGLNNINLDDIDFYKDDPEIILHIRLITWCNSLKQRKAFKKHVSKELILQSDIQQNGRIGVCQ